MKERIISALINLEKKVPCSTDCILHFGTETMKEIVSLQDENGLIKVELHGLEYSIKPVFVAALQDDELCISKYNPN